MGNSKKYSMDEKQDVFQEPATVYETTFTEKLDPSNTDEQEILLRKLLAKGIAQCERGETTPHAQVMAEMKIKHNLKF